MRCAVVTALVFGGVACATTTSTCPVGSQLVDARSPSGRSEWCRVSSTELAALPVPGRSYASTLGFVNAPALPGGAQGPFTSWYPNGARESQGRWHQGRKEEAWTYWHPSGAAGPFRLDISDYFRRVFGE